MMYGPDSSAEILSQMLHQRAPFFFVRIGDGAVECIQNRQGFTCDHETYHPALASEMRYTIAKLKVGDSHVLWGDWRTAVAGSAPNHVDAWCHLVEVERRKLLDYESLLLMRRSPQLLEFYSAVNADPRRKLYIGAHYQHGAPTLLQSLFLPLPTGGVFQHRDVITYYLEHYQPKVILFGAGMGGLIPVVDYWYKRLGGPNEPTCIHLGSALDPLFLSRSTRSRQLSMADARDFLKELL